MLHLEQIQFFILAILAVVGLEEKINLSGSINLGTIGGIILLIVMVGCVALFALKNKAEAGKTTDEEKEEK